MNPRYAAVRECARRGGGEASERASERASASARARTEERERAKVRGRAPESEGEGEKVRARESARESAPERERESARAKEAHTDTPCAVLQTYRPSRLSPSRAVVHPHTLPRKRETQSGCTQNDRL
jgi:hypothetical protein